MSRLKEWLEDLAESFDPEINCCIEPSKRKFKSIISIIFHMMLSKWFIVMLILYLVCAVVSFIMKKGVVQIVIGGALFAVFTSIPIFIFFMIIMIFESFAKQIASLILYGNLSRETYNPIDDAVYIFLSGHK